MTSPDYKSFAVWCVQTAFEACDLDGVDIQDKAVEFGIIKKVPYDPEIHGDSDYVEIGDEWFVFVEQGGE